MPEKLQAGTGRGLWLDEALSVSPAALVIFDLVLLTRREFVGALALAPMAGKMRPKLAVVLVAEQFRADYLFRWSGVFGARGFRRLMENGAFFPDCRYRSSTFTSTGLATIGAGSYPSTHGIVADSWFDPTSGERISARPELLFGSTLGDEVAEFGGGTVVGTAMLDAHAGFLAGQSPDEVFSMDARGAAVARNQQTGDKAWLAAFQRAHGPEQYRNAQWTAGEAKDAPVLRTLAFDPEEPEVFNFLYRASPFAQQAQFELMREIVARESLGQNGGVDMLAAVLESTAWLGLDVGADSILMQHLVSQMDQQISITLDLLDSAVGPECYSFVFTAAHGAPLEPAPKNRVHGEAVAKLVDSALGGKAVDRYLYPFLYLKADARTRERRLTAARAAMRIPGVAGFYTADGDCSHHGEWRARLQNSFHPDHSGDVFFSYAPGYVEDYGEERGVSYGSVYNYDAQVPLILYGPAFTNGTFEQTVEPVDIAPTLARVLGLPQPSASTGRVLAESLVPEPRQGR